MAERVQAGDPASTPRIVLALGPCRSGSTPLVMALAAAGVDSYMQPLKIILRCLSTGLESAWRIPRRPPDAIFLKETFGPYLEAEVEFSPLGVLLEAGVAPDAIELLVVGREPLSTWSSWSQWWGERTTLDLFEASMLATELAHEQARAHGMKVTTYVYEAIRDVDVETVGRRLFEALDITFSRNAIEGWAGVPAIGEPGSPIFWPPMPEDFVVPHIHDRVRQSEGLTYFDRSADVAALPPNDVTRIVDAGLPELYQVWRQRCAIDLRLDFESPSTTARS